ncbi:MAG: ERF family protein [Pseudomonadota bacterium]
MKTSENTDKILPALLAARRDMRAAHKGKKNAHFNYNYANEEAWHDAVQPPLQANDLFLSFSVDGCTRVGTLTTVLGSARVTHVSGQWIEVGGVGEGEDKADKGAYKAQTGLKKYLYALTFALPTTDDVEDTENDKRRAAEELRAKTKADAPSSTTAEVNGKLAAAGLEPEHDRDAKARCRALYDQAKLIDKDEARIISKRNGTDYAKTEEELALYIAGARRVTAAT